MKPICRFCGKYLNQSFVDLGTSPLANNYVPRDKYSLGEVNFPLHAYVCDECHLVQIEEFETPSGIFSDYAYFSSYSESWLHHAKAYVQQMINGFSINEQSFVVELASNDGYLLQYFKEAGVPTLGVEPAANVAAVATPEELIRKWLFLEANTQNP